MSRNRYKKPVGPIAAIVAFVMVFGLGYLIFSRIPDFFMWVVSGLDKK